MQLGKSGKRMAACIILLVCACCFSHADAEETLEYDHVNSQVKIIGSLGKPLGTLMKIEGEVLAYGEVLRKEDQGRAVLRVETIDGRKLSPPIAITFSTFPWTGISEPRPGSSCTYIGFETGCMVGVPHDSWKYVPAVTTPSFHFHVSFVALSQPK